MSKIIYTKNLRALEVLEQSSNPLRPIAKKLGVDENNLYNLRNQF